MRSAWRGAASGGNSQTSVLTTPILLRPDRPAYATTQLQTSQRQNLKEHLDGEELYEHERHRDVLQDGVRK
jgi:hypothetical protein